MRTVRAACAFTIIYLQLMFTGRTWSITVANDVDEDDADGIETSKKKK